MNYYVVTLSASAYPSRKEYRDGLGNRKYTEAWEVIFWDRRYRTVDQHLFPEVDTVKVHINDTANGMDGNSEISCSVLVGTEHNNDADVLRKGRALILAALGDRGNKLYYKDTD